MRKGIMFTIMIFLFMVPIILLASLYADSRIEEVRSSNLAISMQKINYGYEFMREGVFDSIGIVVSEEGNDLVINDTIPRINYTDNLIDFESFVVNNFTDNSISVEFLDSAGGSVDWADFNNFSIDDYDLNYNLLSNGTETISITNTDVSQLENIDSVDIFVEIDIPIATTTGMNPRSSCPQIEDPECIEFNIFVRDVLGNEFEINNELLDVSRRSRARYNLIGDFLEITIGEQAGNDNFITIDASDINADTSLRFSFSTEDFYLSTDPLLMRVSDNNLVKESSV